MVDTIKIPAEELVDGDTFTLKTLTRGTITGIICGHPTIFRKEVHLKYVTLHDNRYKYLVVDLGEEVEVDEMLQKPEPRENCLAKIKAIKRIKL